jgi:phosphate butyryltransferase
MINNFHELIEDALKSEKRTIAVAGAENTDVLLSINNAMCMGLADGILIGDKSKIKETAACCSLDISKFEIVDKKEEYGCANTAVEIVSSGGADILMKGNIKTSSVLKAVLDKDKGLFKSRLLSHVMVYSMASYDKLLFLTDGGMVMYPDLKQKIDIIQNAVKLTSILGIECPKVAPLCAVEVVNTHMQSTIDAALLTKMNQRGQISGCIIDGPLSLDIAINKKSANNKNVHGDVAGDADILLVPNIEAGNILGKSLTYFGGAKSAGIIMGARYPIVLVSRGDNHETKLFSIALGSIVARTIT